MLERGLQQQPGPVNRRMKMILSHFSAWVDPVVYPSIGPILWWGLEFVNLLNQFLCFLFNLGFLTGYFFQDNFDAQSPNRPETTKPSPTPPTNMRKASSATNIVDDLSSIFGGTSTSVYNLQQSFSTCIHFSRSWIFVSYVDFNCLFWLRSSIFWRIPGSWWGNWGKTKS